MNEVYSHCFLIQIFVLINESTGSSCLMPISLQRILLLRFFKTIAIILLMRFYGLFILLTRSLANATFSKVPKVA